MNTKYSAEEKAIIKAAAAILAKGKKESPKKAKVEVKPVSLDLRKAIVEKILADSVRERGNGYQFSHILAAKVFYAAKAKNQPIDPNGMNDKTANILAKAYSLA